MKAGLRQWLLSLTIFVIVLGGLVSVDARVRHRFASLVWDGNGLSSWGDRLEDLGGAVMAAVRHQSIDNAPLLIFAIVGGVLVLFMLRT